MELPLQYKCPLCNKMFASYYVDFYKHMDEEHGSKDDNAVEENSSNDDSTDENSPVDEAEEGDSDETATENGSSSDSDSNDGTFTYNDVRALLRFNRHRYN